MRSSPHTTHKQPLQHCGDPRADRVLSLPLIRGEQYRSCGTCTDTLGHSCLLLAGQRVGLGPRQASVLLTLAGGGVDHTRPQWGPDGSVGYRRRVNFPFYSYTRLMAVNEDRLDNQENIVPWYCCDAIYCINILSILHHGCLSIASCCLKMYQENIVQQYCCDAIWCIKIASVLHHVGFKYISN